MGWGLTSCGCLGKEGGMDGDGVNQPWERSWGFTSCGHLGKEGGEG